MIQTTIQTDLDLSDLAQRWSKPISATVMREIGEAYRQYRERAIWQGQQLHDGSAFAPLKPETIRRKRGEMNRKNTWVDKRNRARVTRVSGPSLAPEKPLIDTGNLAKSVVIDAKDGSLTLSIGPQRAAAGLGHQTGHGALPQRVHHSWNPEIKEKIIRPRVAEYYRLVAQQSVRKQTLGA